MNKIKGTIVEAGKILSDHFGKIKTFTTKSTKFDLVTEADKEIELFLKKKLSELIPQSKFLAEETDSSDKKADYLWIIDPIDGTTNFVHGFPFVCISVALSVLGTVQQAFVYNPVLDDFFEAERGKGSYQNGERITVSSTDSLEKSLLATGFPYDFASCTENNVRYFEHFHKQVQGIRRPGSAALDLCYVANGVFEGFWEWYLKPWDVSAGLLIIEEANGRVTDFYGNPYQMESANILAANPVVHQKMMKEISYLMNPESCKND